MPVTRRKRANPPEQPDNSSPAATPVEGPAETPVAQSQETPAMQPVQPSPSQGSDSTDTSAALPSHTVAVESAVEGNSYAAPVQAQPAPYSNGDRPERTERSERIEQPQPQFQPQPQQSYAPPIEGGRRTARGELFRRPPQMPPVQPQPAPVQAAPPPPPTHEITLPLGNLLHLSYNPGYTGADEARSVLLHKLANESKAGGRARCWNCGSIAIVYDRWSTRNKTFGDVGVAFCEICGVWSVL